MPGGTYETYQHDGWTCGYRHKTGCEPAIVLLHPVGIGLSSWFWTRVMAELPNEVYAPDFIGCGRSDAWDPAERGLFLPLDYSRQVEELWRQKIGKPCCVVAQGGLAPVGVYLASRSSDRWDGARAVAGLALSAPPPFSDLAEGIESKESRHGVHLLDGVGLTVAFRTGSPGTSSSSSRRSGGNSSISCGAASSSNSSRTCSSSPTRATRRGSAIAGA